MSHGERIKALAAVCRVFRTSDLTKLGYDGNGVRRLVAKGLIRRIKPSYFCLCEPDESLSETARVAQLFPDGVLCMQSALAYYGYLEQAPQVWQMAVDRNTSKARFKLEHPAVQPHYMKKKYLSFGVTTAQFDDCTMQIFDRERLICECIFYEKKMDPELFISAIRGYVADEKKDVQKLLEHAEKRRILKKLKDRIGIWLRLP